jgi:hypothetical protein
MLYIQKNGRKKQQSTISRCPRANAKQKSGERTSFPITVQYPHGNFRAGDGPIAEIRHLEGERGDKPLLLLTKTKKTEKWFPSGGKLSYGNISSPSAEK